MEEGLQYPFPSPFKKIFNLFNTWAIFQVYRKMSLVFLWFHSVDLNRVPRPPVGEWDFLFWCALMKILPQKRLCCDAGDITLGHQGECSGFGQDSVSKLIL